MMPLLIAWVAGITLFPTEISETRRDALSAGGALVGAFAGWFFIKNRLRCPRCGTNFRQDRISKLGR